MDIAVRPEARNDWDRVNAVVREAFGRADEARLVSKLRSCDHVLSLVAVVQGVVVGQAMFSPVSTQPGAVAGLAHGLAPVAVAPRSQRIGVGSRLIEFGLGELRREGVGLVVVLGDPAYYRRFGFAPAAELGLRCKWGGEEGAFQVLELEAGSAARHQGLVHYLPVFDDVA